MNQWIQMRAIRDEDKMDFIDPAEGNSHITAGSEIDIKAKKDAYIYVKTKITNCGKWLHQNDHSCHWKFLVVHARDRVSLKSLPSNGKPVVPVFRQVCHFQTRTEAYGHFLSQCDAFVRSEGSCGKNKTLRSSIFCAAILPFPPRSLALSCFLSPRPQESTPPPPPPPPPDPGQYDLAVFTGDFLCYLLRRCHLSSAGWRNGDSLGSRVRPRVDTSHPNHSVNFI